MYYSSYGKLTFDKIGVIMILCGFPMILKYKLYQILAILPSLNNSK